MIERARTLAFAAAPTYRVAGRAARHEADVFAAFAPQRAGRRRDRLPSSDRVGCHRVDLGRAAAIAGDVRGRVDVDVRHAHGGANVRRGGG